MAPFRPLSPNEGEKNPMTHLTEDDVRQIRRMRADKVPIKEVAAKFGISEGTVSRIANRMAWGHVP